MALDSPHHAHLDILFLFGCTGCGKGAVGRCLAQHMDAEIISVDSMKIYRGMDIGTAKPPPDIRSNPPHHLIDVVDPSESFSVARYIALADEAAARIAARDNRILAVGGTALYIKAWTEGLFEGPQANTAIRDELQRRAADEGTAVLYDELVAVDPDSASRIHRNDLKRLVRALEVFRLTGRPISQLQVQWDQDRSRHRCTLVGLRRARDDQNHRTNLRVQRMMEQGLVDEVRALWTSTPPMGHQARQAVGYAEMIDYLEGATTLEGTIERIKINTRRLAKSQRTWFRRFPGVLWIDITPDEPPESVSHRILKELGAWHT